LRQEPGAALAGCFKENDGAGDRDIERRDGAGHGYPEEVVAGAAHQLVEACAFAAKDEGAGGGEVELVVVLGATLVEADDPDAGGFDLLEGAGHVDDAGHADVLDRAGGGFGGDGAEGGGAALGGDDAVDAGTVGGTQQGAEVLRVFDAIEREQESVFARDVSRDEEIFEVGELFAADEGDDALVSGGFGELGKVVAWFHAQADAVFAAERGEAIEFSVGPVAGEADVVEGPGAGTHCFLHGMEAVQNVHLSSVAALAGAELFCKAAPVFPRGKDFPALSASFFFIPASDRADMSSQAIHLRTMDVSAQTASAVIAERLKRQDPLLLDELIVEYQHRLLRYLLYLTGNRELAEDTFQETWMRVLVRGSQFNGNSRFDTWLFTIARNLVIDFRRRRVMASLEEMSENTENERPFEVASADPTPFDNYLSRQNSSLVASALLTLDPLHREVLVLRFHEELALDQIATVTGAPLSTVKSRLYRGLAALRPRIEQAKVPPAQEGRR
jgi:RNA polymerase sigma-70 factor (ECF subfamily)